MKFLILEAEKRNSILYLSGCFKPDKGNDSDSERLKVMVKGIQFLNENKNIFSKKGTIIIRKEPCDSLVLALSYISNITGFSVKQAKDIVFIGDIDKRELQDTLEKMSEGWDADKITVLESK
jgi:hypothetical protein